MRYPAARTWLAVFTIATAVAYSSALRAPFEFDDHPSIRQNASIRQLWPLSVPLNPPKNTSVAGRQFVNLTLAVNYAINEQAGVDLSGPNATLGYHIANVLFHLACGLLLFGIIRRTLGAIADDNTIDPTFVAGATTLLWLLHPIQSEAVDYIVQRTEILVSVCYVAVLYCSIRARDADPRTRRWWYGAAIVACGLGMASKEVMVTAPLMVVLYDRAFQAESWQAVFADRGRRRFYGALLATEAVVLWSVVAGARGHSVGFALGMTSWEYFYSQAWAIAHYLRLIAWPDALNFDYGDRPVTGLAGVPGLVLMAILGVATIIAWTRPRWLWLGFLGAWFFLLLAPSSSFVPIRTEIAAERRIYLASAALFLLVVLGLAGLWQRRRTGKHAQRIAVASLAAALGAATFIRGETYGNSELLYRDVIAKSPSNSHGYLGVGMALFMQGSERAADAEGFFQRAIDADTTSFTAWQSLGVLQLTQRRWQEATYTFERALRIQPDNLDAIAGAARARFELGDADAAIPLVDRLGPSNTPAMWAMGTLLVHQGRGGEALKYLEPAVAAGPPPSAGVALLSLAYAQSARTEQAERTAAEATQRGGDTSDVYELAGMAMIIVHRPEKARAYLQRALALNPQSESIRRALVALDTAIINAKKRAPRR